MTPTTRHLVLFVVATAPQSGKSTAAGFFAQWLATPRVESSSMINERVERRLGLEPGTIVRVRRTSPATYRPELVDEGNRMAAEGMSPGLLCVLAGYRVIDGIRRGTELAASVVEARARGFEPFIVCVERAAGDHATDNTEAATLRSMADVVIQNDRIPGEAEAVWHARLEAACRAALVTARDRATR